MRFLLQISIVVLIITVACVQLVLLYKYNVIRKILAKMQNQSSGEHRRYKDEKKTGSRE